MILIVVHNTTEDVTESYLSSYIISYMLSMAHLPQENIELKYFLSDLPIKKVWESLKKKAGYTHLTIHVISAQQIYSF